MILSRAPVRITLGGGGTDLASYYSKHGGFLIAGAINKYCHILASERFYPNIRLSYRETEIVDKVVDIKQPIFKACMELLGIGGKIELHSAADVPSGCGLGSSSSFTVALLNALHSYKRDYVTHRQLAEEACRVEIEMLDKPIGKQDQYIGSFGGLTCFTFNKDGSVVVEPLKMSFADVEQLEHNLLLFFTGNEREAVDILAEQDKKCKESDPDMENNLHCIKTIGLQTKDYLERGELDMLGHLMHQHWLIKKERSKIMSTPFIDECYGEALKNGAIGGKLVGAGNSGFLMFYCPNERNKVIKKMTSLGLRWECFRFDFEGAKVLVNT